MVVWSPYNVIGGFSMFKPGSLHDLFDPLFGPLFDPLYDRLFGINHEHPATNNAIAIRFTNCRVVSTLD